MLSRPLLVVALVAVLGASGAGLVVSERDDVPAPPVELAVTPQHTPVLSARRVPALLAAPVADRLLGVTIEAILARQPGDVCLAITSSGRPVFTRQADVPLAPASVEKLVTAAAILQVLGPEHTFRTAIVAAAAPEGGVVAGDAWIVGGGDPLLATADYAARFRNQPQVHTPLETLADAVGAAGITSIQGTLRGDGSRYDDDRYPDDWPDRFADQDQSGPLSGLTVNDGWTAFPPNPDTNVPDETPAADPPAQAAAVLGGLLTARGTGVAATGSGVAPAGAVELAAVESPPLSEIVGEMLRESDNQTAELLLKELAVARGRPATSADGAAAALEVAIELGLPMGGVVVGDGSGLGDANRMTCGLATAILDAAGLDSPLGQGLAVAGQTGTLALRFLESPVMGRLHAKTGTLNTVTSLAGFLDTTPGARLTFALIVNLAEPGRVGADDLARQQELAEAMARYPEGPSLDELGPQPVASGG